MTLIKPNEPVTFLLCIYSGSQGMRVGTQLKFKEGYIARYPYHDHFIVTVTMDGMLLSLCSVY